MFYGRRIKPEERLRWWYKDRRATKRALEEFRAAPLKLRHKFETLLEAEEEDLTRYRQLRQGGDAAKALAAKLDGCSSRRPCLSRASARCALPFRLSMTRAVLSLFVGTEKLWLITFSVPRAVAFGGEVGLDRPKLPRSPRLLRGWLRRELVRARLSDVPLLGWIEVDYNRKRKRYVVHFHLIAGDVDEDRFDTLGKRIRSACKNGWAFDIRPVDADAWAKTVSYAFKCYPSRYDSEWEDKNKGRLTGRLARRIYVWMDKFEFEDFVFAQGFRRYSRGFVRLEKQRKAQTPQKKSSKRGSEAL